MIHEEAVPDELRYPVGRFEPREELTPADRRELIEEIAALPGRLEAAVSDLTPEQLDTPYRPGGWTVRQVVHHLPDSHMNGYVRFKLAVTENTPTIKPYDQAAWAELPDARDSDIGPSLTLLEGLHERWIAFLESLGPEDFDVEFDHPELGPIDLAWNLQLYAWHCRHHLAHVTSLRERMAW
jgi:hypothetical protein